MKPRRARASLAAALGLTLAYGLFSTSEVRHASAEPPRVRTPAPALTSHDTGPRRLEIPARAVIAESSEQLARLLADPNGPREIWLRARRYAGDFRIARTVALKGEAGATLRGSGNGTVLSIQAPGVTIDNLTLQRSGRRFTAEDTALKAKGQGIAIRHVRIEDSLFGISLAECPHCTVEHAHVRGPGAAEMLKGDGIKIWESDHAVVRSCLVEGVRDVVVWYSRHVLLANNTVRDSRYGTHFMYAHDSIVRDSRVVDNVVGIFVMYSSRLHVQRNLLAGARGAAGVGLGFKESDGVEVTGNWLVANTTGTYLDETPRSQNQPVVFAGNTFALNEAALRFHGVRESLTFEGNTFTQNALLADVEGGGDALSTTFRGNRYSDYAGYDLDGDGTGDVAYQVKRLSGDLLDARPSLAFFRGTVGLGLIDVIANAMPVFASRVLLEDRTPRFDTGSAL